MTIRVKYNREPKPDTREKVRRFFEQLGFSAGDNNVFTGPDLPYGALVDLGTSLTLSAGIATRGLQFRAEDAFLELS